MKQYHLKKGSSIKGVWYKTLVIFCLVGMSFDGISQIHYQPYSYEHYQRYMQQVYADSLTHTSVKPFVRTNFDSKYDINDPDKTQNWWLRKLLNEHLIEVKKDDHTFYLDLLGDFVIGAERGTNSKSLWTNTRGAQVGLSVNNKFSLYVNFFENQARYPSFVDSMAMQIGGLPGQGFSKKLSTAKYDWMNTTANLSYKVSEGLNFNLAYDKLHIGDGYRSVLLSDNPYNFSYARIHGVEGKWQYNSIWAYMNDLRNPRVEDVTDPEVTRLGNGIKYGAFHYVDYLPNEQSSIGLFHSMIWAKGTQQGENKINGGLGLNAKYRLFDRYVIYGQLYADDLSNFGFSSSRDRRVAYQLGAKTFDLFNIKNLNVTAEYNQAAPYTYQSSNNRINYSSNGESLAHPRGANFREALGILTYGYDRWQIYAQTMFARYGLDADTEDNVGTDLFKETPTREQFHTGQGQRNDLFYNELRLAYIINPKYNLRLELGLINRNNRNTATSEKVNTNVFTFGLRSSFRTFQREY